MANIVEFIGSPCHFTEDLHIHLGSLLWPPHFFIRLLSWSLRRDPGLCPNPHQVVVFFLLQALVTWLDTLHSSFSLPWESQSFTHSTRLSFLHSLLPTFSVFSLLGQKKKKPKQKKPNSHRSWEVRNAVFSSAVDTLRKTWPRFPKATGHSGSQL